MSNRLERDLAHLPCPLCPEARGLELALRLEVETESEIVIAACPACKRLYEVTPGGQLRLQSCDHRALSLHLVSCPHCHSVGHAVSYDLPQADAESHLVITCSECEHTFSPGENVVASCD